MNRALDLSRMPFVGMIRGELTAEHTNGFQNKVSELLKLIYGSDIQSISDQSGDKGCDIYRFSSATVYQVYAPYSYDGAKCLSKINHDLERVLDCGWIIKEWVFIYNQNRIHSEVALAISKLNRLHAGIALSVLSLDEFCELIAAEASESILCCRYGLKYIGFESPAGGGAVTLCASQTKSNFEIALSKDRENYAEGAWPLHKSTIQSHEENMKTVWKALDQGDEGNAWGLFKENLFKGGYLELWQTRIRLCERFKESKIFKEPSMLKELGWLYFKGLGYAYMEMGEKKNIEYAEKCYAHAHECIRIEGDTQNGGALLRYKGDLSAIKGDPIAAIILKREALGYLSGISKVEAELEYEYFKAKYGPRTDSQCLRRFSELSQKFGEIYSWRYWLCRLEIARWYDNALQSEIAFSESIDILRRFDSEIYMPRTRKKITEFIDCLLEKPEACNWRDFQLYVDKSRLNWPLPNSIQ